MPHLKVEVPKGSYPIPLYPDDLYRIIDYAATKLGYKTRKAEWSVKGDYDLLSGKRREEHGGTKLEVKSRILGIPIMELYIRDNTPDHDDGSVLVYMRTRDGLNSIPRDSLEIAYGYPHGFSTRKTAEIFIDRVSSLVREYLKKGEEAEELEEMTSSPGQSTGVS